MKPSRTPAVDALLTRRPDLKRCDCCDGLQTLDRGDRQSEVLCWSCDATGVVPAVDEMGCAA